MLSTSYRLMLSYCEREIHGNVFRRTSSKHTYICHAKCTLKRGFNFTVWGIGMLSMENRWGWEERMKLSYMLVGLVCVTPKHTLEWNTAQTYIILSSRGRGADWRHRKRGNKWGVNLISRL